MADPRYVVPYHDPHDSPINYEILNFLRDANPTLENLPSTDEPVSLHVSSDDIVNPNLSLDDPMIWDIFNQPNSGGQSQGEGPSQNRERRATENLEQRYLDDGKPISVWPPPAIPFQCTCCQVLREIIHTDGNCTTKLEIHGRLGIICHAVLEIKDQVMYGSSEPRYHMFDFCKKSIDSVKQFLQQYCNDQTKAGYIMVQDPLSVFYEALCVGMEWDENLQNDASPVYSEPQQADQTEGGNEAERGSRSTLAQQRERTGRLTLKDFEAYFHLPIEEAAKIMNLCPTVVKKICRRYGMTRWPHRKIKSIQRQISNLRANSNWNDSGERTRAQAEIQRLEVEISNVCSGVTN